MRLILLIHFLCFSYHQWLKRNASVTHWSHRSVGANGTFFCISSVSLCSKSIKHVIHSAYKKSIQLFICNKIPGSVLKETQNRAAVMEATSICFKGFGKDILPMTMSEQSIIYTQNLRKDILLGSTDKKIMSTI